MKSYMFGVSSTNALANVADQSFINKKLSEIIMELNKRKIFDARVIVPDEGATSCRIIEACGKKFYIEFNSNHRITSVKRGVDNSVDLSNRIWSSLKVSDIVEYILKECNFIDTTFMKQESMLKSKLIENLLKEDNSSELDTLINGLEKAYDRLESINNKLGAGKINQNQWSQLVSQEEQHIKKLEAEIKKLKLKESSLKKAKMSDSDKSRLEKLKAELKKGNLASQNERDPSEKRMQIKVNNDIRKEIWNIQAKYESVNVLKEDQEYTGPTSESVLIREDSKIYELILWMDNPRGGNEKLRYKGTLGELKTKFNIDAKTIDELIRKKNKELKKKSPYLSIFLN